MVGEDGVGDEQWRPAVKTDGGAVQWWRCFPSLAASLTRSGLGFVGRELGSGEPRDLSRRPPPLFIAQCDRGPPAIVSCAPPIRTRIKGSYETLGPI